MLHSITLLLSFDRSLSLASRLLLFFSLGRMSSNGFVEDFEYACSGYVRGLRYRLVMHHYI